MSTEYVAHKFAALEEVVAVSAAFQKKYNATARLKLVLTEGKYRKPAITALGIGIFQQLCGFNSLSESNFLSLNVFLLISSVLLCHHVFASRFR